MWRRPVGFSSLPNLTILWDYCQTSVIQFTTTISLYLYFRRLWNVPKPLLIASITQFIRPAVSAIWNNSDLNPYLTKWQGQILISSKVLQDDDFITCRKLNAVITEMSDDSGRNTVCLLVILLFFRLVALRTKKERSSALKSSKSAQNNEK